jgi:glutamate synthase domain-containing protein 2
LNTGEGGVSEHHLASGADIFYQTGTAKYGVKDEHKQLCDEILVALAAMLQIKMFEIKISQGAKPAKSGKSG